MAMMKIEPRRGFLLTTHLLLVPLVVQGQAMAVTRLPSTKIIIIANIGTRPSPLTTVKPR